MTPDRDFDRLVAGWLRDEGPDDLDPFLLESALGAARRTSRRGRLMAVVSGPSPWPRGGAGTVGSWSAGRLTPRVNRWLTLLALLGLLVLALGAAVVASLGSRPTEQVVSGPMELVATGEMSQSRRQHTATLLADGRVLIAGGRSGFLVEPENSAELFDPATGTFRPIASLAEDRIEHSATLLPDGRVVLIGGRNEEFAATSTVEVFDPATGTFADGGTMRGGRFGHVATALDDGRVLVAGGAASIGLAPSPEIGLEVYDPERGTSTRVPDADGALGDQWLAAVAHRDGRVVLLGNRRLLVVDIETGALNAVPLGLPATTRFAGATTLLDGRLAVALAQSAGSGATWQIAAFSPTFDEFQLLATMDGRPAGGLTLLTDGRVAFVTAVPEACQQLEAWLFNPMTRATTSAGAVPGMGYCNGLDAGRLTGLADGTFLITGGSRIGGEEAAAASRSRPVNR